MSDQDSQPVAAEEDATEKDDVEQNDGSTEAIAADETPADDIAADDTPDLEPSSDSRTNARVNLDRPLIVRLSSGETIKAHLVNLSCGGLAFEYPAPAESGVTFGFLFQLSTKTDTINIQAEGVARHSHVKSESFVTGIQFTKISEEHIDIIEEFVEYKLSTAEQLTGFAVSHRHRG